MFLNPSADEIRNLLQGVRSIAIVGASPKPERPSHSIAQFFIEQGLTVVPVHPAIRELFGVTAYPSLSAIPFKVDMADFFINADRVGPMVDEAVGLGIRNIWMQDGVIDEAAAQRARDAGHTVVMNDCSYRRWRQLMR